MHRYLVATALCALPLVAQQPAGNAPTTMHPPSVITTSASGEARYVPDRATISLGVQTRALSAAKASADNALRQRAVIDAIRAQGIAADQISTVNYNLNAEQVYNPQAGDKAPRVTGYVAMNTVRVEVKKIEQVGALIDAAIAKGANEVSSLEFHSSAPDSLRRVALADAYRQALADATVLAQAAGGQLGELIELTTGEPGVQELQPMSFRKAAMALSTPISPGETGLNAVVLARWRLVTVLK
ncbi:MAG: SIMPL domain-containing protein [Gemmatimonadaceae bacterium]|nr:SIMPL domain-containing protein [Gemmatimonadaceae bacterium]